MFIFQLCVEFVYAWVNGWTLWLWLQRWCVWDKCALKRTTHMTWQSEVFYLPAQTMVPPLFLYNISLHAQNEFHYQGVRCVRCSMCGNESLWVSLRIPYQMHVGGKKLGLTELFDWKLLFELQRSFQFIIEITCWHVGHWQPCISRVSTNLTAVVWDHHKRRMKIDVS